MLHCTHHDYVFVLFEPVEAHQEPAAQLLFQAVMAAVPLPMNIAIPTTPSLPTTAICAEAPSAMIWSGEMMPLLRE
jgi:hypothetical protein